MASFTYIFLMVLVYTITISITSQKMLTGAQSIFFNFFFQTFEDFSITRKLIFSGHICDSTPDNEALCGKINFDLWAKNVKLKISQKLKYT